MIRRLANEKSNGPPGVGACLAGYAVEGALKACIIKMHTSDDWQEQGFSNQCWSHRLELLMRLAGLETEISSAGKVTDN